MEVDYASQCLAKTDSTAFGISAIAELLVIFVGWLMEIGSCANVDLYVTACVTRYDSCETVRAETMVGSGNRCCVVT